MGCGCTKAKINPYIADCDKDTLPPLSPRVVREAGSFDSFDGSADCIADCSIDGSYDASDEKLDKETPLPRSTKGLRRVTRSFELVRSMKKSGHTTELHLMSRSRKTSLDIPFNGSCNPDSIEMFEKLGEGSYGIVYRARYCGMDVAYKEYKVDCLIDESSIVVIKDDFSRQASLISKLRHPNIVLNYGVVNRFPDLGIVSELMQMSVRSLLRQAETKALKITWKLVVRIAKDCAAGMQYLHMNDIIHRDIKAENLLMTEGFMTKVSDFDLTRYKTCNLKMTSCGTPCWAAPEIMKGEPYDEKVDVYSFGIVLWELATCKVPYKQMCKEQGINAFTIVFKVCNEDIRPKMPSFIPVEMQPLMDIMIECWNKHPKCRPSFENINNKLQKMKIL